MVLAALAALAALWLGRTEPQPRADIRFVSAEVFTLDPQRMSWQQDLRVARALYEPLLVRDAVTGLPKAGLAESWSCSEDGRTWTFALRRDARWSDGAPVTANDVRYAWMRALLPDLATDFAGIQLRIDGAEAFLRWRAEALVAHTASPGDPEALWSRTRETFDRLVAMRSPDDHTLVITLVQPVPY
jgi:ABC-type transport system substrate-binding protein